MTDVVLDARVTALEENSDGNTQNGDNRLIFISESRYELKALVVIKYVSLDFRNHRFYCSINVLLNHS